MAVRGLSVEREDRRMNELDDFAEKYFSEHKGKSVPLDLLLAWLSETHDHREDGTPFVHSMDLHRWAIKNALPVPDEGVEPPRYRRTSSTTGREHWCELPPEETCYWSGDPYAPHEMGF